jgi:hypothetical protein
VKFHDSLIILHEQMLDDELSPVGQNLSELRESPRQEVGFRLILAGERMCAFDDPVGVENAALAFIPEEYLSPLPRGASNAMIKNIGAMAGLRFEEAALEAISSFCSDMPFWIRKACSSIHGKIETAISAGEPFYRDGLLHA